MSLLQKQSASIPSNYIYVVGGSNYWWRVGIEVFYVVMIGLLATDFREMS